MQRVYIAPNERGRIKYSVRGIITKIESKESGWWIFKEKISLIYVCIEEKQLDAFNEIARTKMRVFGEGNLMGITQLLKIGVDNEDLEKYRVGMKIGITFGYSDPNSQFLTGTVPLRITEIQVIKPETVLENEIKV